MTFDEAVHHVRSMPKYADLVRDSYLGPDLYESAKRFSSSAEFQEVLRLLTDGSSRRSVVDLGAGSGIASWAFAQSDFDEIWALEPNESEEVGRGAIKRLCADLPVHTINAFAEEIPVPDEFVDVVYARQVLHHTSDLGDAVSECSRILKRGGVFFACREHVCNNHRELEQFLANHPLHQLFGGENAYPLDSYVSAIRAAGLQLVKVLGPWDSVINAFPAVRTKDELDRYPQIALERKFGVAGRLLSSLPPVKALAWARIRKPKPGRPYAFLAVKP